MYIPRDIKMIIVKKLDIDTRRSLKIYSKLNIPIELQEKLNIILKNQKKIGKIGIYITLKIKRNIENNKYFSGYTIVRLCTNEINYYTNHFHEHFTTTYISN